MSLHIVQKPFMSRLGQFEEGKQTLCVGLDVKTLLHTPGKFQLQLSKGIYEIDPIQALAVTDTNESFWRNPRGKLLAIVPLSEFERKE